jgi:hypothetical protein
MPHDHDPTKPVRASKNAPRGCSDSNSIQIRFSNQICAKSLEIHNFCSVTRNLTNNIPLETLEHVESNSALIICSFSIQFETIFKLNQTYLLASLIHIF